MLAPARAENENAATVLPAIGRDVQIDDKYVLDEGLVFLTGIQALVRVAARPACAPTAAPG